jgi:hypothetical protein
MSFFPDFIILQFNSWSSTIIIIFNFFYNESLILFFYFYNIMIVLWHYIFGKEIDPIQKEKGFSILTS